MNQRSDIDRLLTTWLDDGPTTMPDSVVDVVADRIGRTRQRRSWRLLRRLQMNTYVKLAAAAVIGVIAVGVIYLNLPGRTDVGGPSPTPSATATPLRNGTLPGGRYRITGVSPSTSPTLSVVADVPAGWLGFPSVPALTGATTEEPPGGILIGFMLAESLYSDPCHWDLDGTGTEGLPGDVEVGPTVDDLVAKLRSQQAYTASTPVPVTFGAFEGSELELQLSGEDIVSTCDIPRGDSSGAYFVFSGKEAGFYAQGPDSRWHLSIVDVDGTRLIAMISYFDGTPQADVTAAFAIVRSMEFTP